MPPSKPPPPKQKPRALGDEEDFGEHTYGRGLKAVTEAIEQVAKHQALLDAEAAKKAPAKAPKKKK